MPISRLRVRLATWFGITFIASLVLLDLGFLLYSQRSAERRLTNEVRAAAVGLAASIRREQALLEGVSTDSAVREAMAEWPAGPDVIGVFDSVGRMITARGPDTLISRLDFPGLVAGSDGIRDLPVDREGQLRTAWVRDSESPPLVVIAASSTAPLREEQEALRTWLLASLPLIAVGAAAAGYALARRGLRPVRAMASDLDAIDADRLDRRLPVRQPPDELDQLASHFNGLLDRLATARESSRRFVAQAAHQLRTPLTIVRGESSLSLERAREPEEYRNALRRIRLAAEQMSHRVEELFLLAEAEAGERPALQPGVELDGIAVEAVDLMRGRAFALARTLEFGRIEAVPVRGDQRLLREAALELIENACRHGQADVPVRIEVFREQNRGALAVGNLGPPIPGPGGGSAEGLGLTIVRWVAEVHGGSLIMDRDGDFNSVRLELPLSGDEA